MNDEERMRGTELGIACEVGGRIVGNLGGGNRRAGWGDRLAFNVPSLSRSVHH